MADAVQQLKNLKPDKDFFVGIDSDGCVFNTMELKHKECFCPPFINHYDLQAVAKYAREVWEFVNLYSKSRGANRFKALILSLDMLAERHDVTASGVAVTRAEGVRDWMRHETKLGNPALHAALEKNADPDLQQALSWSLDVNESVAKIVRGVPPFPGVLESLDILHNAADMLVVSQTPGEALVREWQEHGIDRYARAIAGQESGTKTEHISYAAKGKYAPSKILMIGDAPGDFDAARANGALFYPINPGAEEASWQRFYKEAVQRFLAGKYAGAYENDLIKEFERRLPENPPWKSRPL